MQKLLGLMTAATLSAGCSVSLFTASAQAENMVSYVSAGGDDTVSDGGSNRCNKSTEPCRTIGHALVKTFAGGEIKCLEGNGPETQVEISIPISINCPNGTVFGTIIINMPEASYPSGVVKLRGIEINGIRSFTLGNLVFQVIQGGASVHIENCTFHGGEAPGIVFNPSSSMNLFIHDTVVNDNQGGGILIKPTGSASVRFDLRDTRVENNRIGILVDSTATTGDIRGVIADSRVAGNTTNGIQANSRSGKAVVMVSDTAVQGNNVGLVASGAGSIILAEDTQVTGNGHGLYAVGGGQLLSYGNNHVNQNTTADGAFTGPVAVK